MHFASNPALPFILKNWQGNPVSSTGRFFHPEYPFELNWKDVAKWKSKPNPYAKAKKTETWRASVVKDDGFLQHDRDVFVWLGHASFFFRMNGRNILVDPVFGKLSALMPRYSDLPVPISKLKKLDYIFLTHDHRDHCDMPSLKELVKNNPQVKFVTGLGMSTVLSSFVKKQAITEMGWYQQFEDEAIGLKITYLPTRHWCRRWLTDTNRRLWGAFVFQTNERTIYLGGDSGYGEHFKKTASLFPKIDFAFLGIGAFAPVWFMQSFHMNPSAAFDAFQDLKAKHMVPMHFGTFDLSDEPLGEPLRLMKGIVKEKGLNGEVVFNKIGEAMTYL